MPQNSRQHTDKTYLKLSSQRKETETISKQFRNSLETVLFQTKQNAAAAMGCDGRSVLFWLKQNSFKIVSKTFQFRFIVRAV